MECEEAADKIEKGDEVEVDFSTGVITNKTKNETYQSQPFPEFLQKMIDADGLVNYVKMCIRDRESKTCIPALVDQEIQDKIREDVYKRQGSTFFAVILGFVPAIILTLTAPDGLKPNKVVYTILDILVNIFRSFPFVILMVIVIPRCV